MFNLIFLLFYGVSSGFSGTSLLYVLTFQFVICCLLKFREKDSAIDPLLIFYIGVIIVNIADVILISNVGTHSNRIYTYVIPKYIDNATQIWCVSSTLFALGYQWAIKKRIPSIAFSIRRNNILKNLFWILLVLNILAIVGYGVNLRGNQFGKIFGLLNSISILFFARLWAKENSKTYMTYAIVLFLLETYMALISSFLRFELILPTFYLFIGYFIGKGSVRYVFSYRIIPLLLIIVVYSSVFSSLKNNRSNFISVFSDGGEPVKQDNNDEHSSALLDRSANLAQLTNILELVNKNGFYEGRASSPILIALVPRVLWPDKPLIQLGAWFALEIGVAYKDESGRTNNSVNMTVPGELYLDFGWIGVIIGSVLFGASFALLWNATDFYSSASNITGTIFGGYLLVLSIGGYGDLQIVVTLLSTYLIFLVLKQVLSSVIKG